MKKIVIISIILVIVLISVILINNLYFKEKPSQISKEEGIEKETSECFEIKEEVVRGDSLSGIIEDGQTVRILSGYYNCNEIKREDIVAYDYAGNPDPIIKIVKAIPGDKFSLKKTEDLSGWNIYVNDEIVTNSEDQPYFLDENRHRMLSLYERDYQGVIPEESYLILGNLISGSLDSTRFGLIHKNDILGKVER